MSERFEQLKATFLAWADLTDDARARELEILKTRDPAMAAELEKLFVADARGAPIDLGPQIPRYIGRFRVVREIGRGGMGVVYEAEQDLPRRRVALKTALTATATYDALFRREVQAMVEVIHPGIPQVYEVFAADGRTVAAMELVEGEPLVRVLDRPGSRDERVSLLLRIAEAVAYAHGRGVVHRDLKPANVLVTAAGQPKVIDFGIATLGESHGPAGSGSLTWMAPEQLDGATVDARADVYALGAIGWRMLVGEERVDAARLIARFREEHPAKGPATREERRAILEAKRAPAPMNPGLPVDLHAVLAKALDPDPARRYADAGAFAEELQRHLQGRAVDALTSPVARAEAWISRRRRQVTRAAVGVVVVGVIGGLAGTAATIWPRMKREESATAGLRAVQALAGTGDEAAIEERFKAYVRSDVLGTDALSEAWSWHATLQRSTRVSDLVASVATAVTPERRSAAVVALAEALLEAEAWDPFVRVVEGAEALGRPDLAAHAARVRWDLADTPWLGALNALTPLPAPSGRARVLDDGSFLRVDGADLERVDASGARLAATTLPGPTDSVVCADGAVWARVGRRLLRVGLPELTVSVAIEAPFEIGRFLLGDIDGDGTRELYVHAPYPIRELYRVRDGALVRLDPAITRAQLDINGLVAADLEGDGSDELVVSSAGWKTRDLRVWDGQTTARLRLKGGPTGVGRAAGGAPWIVAMVGEVLDREPLDLAVFDARLAVLQRQTLPTRMEHLFVTDLDADGIDDVLLNRNADGAVAVYAARGEKGGLAPAVPLPGLQVLDAAGGRVWWTDGEQAWVSGAGGTTALPARTVAPRGPVAEVPALDLPEPVRAIWGRLEELSAAGLPVEAAEALTWLGRVAPPEASTPLLARAMELLPPAKALAVAQSLADGRALDPEVARRAADVLGGQHAFEGLPRVGVWDGVVEALSTETHFGFEGPIDPRFFVDRPESVRRMALAPGLAVRATSDRGPLLTLPLQWDGRAMEIVAELSLETVDWAAGLELALETGGEEPVFVLARGGGGPSAQHRLSAFCGDTNVADMAWVERPATIRIHLTRLPTATGCAVEGFGRGRIEGVAGTGPVRLQLRSHQHKGWENGAVLGVLRSLDIRGAVPAAATEAGADARRFASGEAEAVTRMVADGPPLVATLAAAELGQDASASLARLEDRDLRFLLRTNPDRWLADTRRVLPDRFVSLTAEAWEQAIGYDEAEALGRSAALIGLPLDDEAGRMLALARVRALLDVEGGRLEAESLLARMREGPDPADAWSLTARLLLRAGDRAGATAAIASWLAVSGAEVEDRVFDDAELAAVAPAGVVPTARYRRAGGMSR